MVHLHLKRSKVSFFNTLYNRISTSVFCELQDGWIWCFGPPEHQKRSEWDPKCRFWNSNHQNGGVGVIMSIDNRSERDAFLNKFFELRCKFKKFICWWALIYLGVRFIVSAHGEWFWAAVYLVVKQWESLGADQLIGKNLSLWPIVMFFWETYKHIEHPWNCSRFNMFS